MWETQKYYKHIDGSITVKNEEMTPLISDLLKEYHALLEQKWNLASEHEQLLKRHNELRSELLTQGYEMNKMRKHQSFLKMRHARAKRFVSMLFQVSKSCNIPIPLVSCPHLTRSPGYNFWLCSEFQQMEKDAVKLCERCYKGDWAKDNKGERTK